MWIMMLIMAFPVLGLALFLAAPRNLAPPFTYRDWPRHSSITGR
jgi:hypothetical protein